MNGLRPYFNKNLLDTHFVIQALLVREIAPKTPLIHIEKLKYDRIFLF